VTQNGISLPQLQDLVQVAQRTANLRSHLSDVALTVTSEAAVAWAAASCTGHEISVGYQAPLSYPDGTPAFDLWSDADTYGEASTVSAIELLHDVIAGLEL
jgi:hypothetical protein